MVTLAVAQSRKAIASRFGLSETQLQQIEREGLNKGGPRSDAALPGGERLSSLTIPSPGFPLTAQTIRSSQPGPGQPHQAANPHPWEVPMTLWEQNTPGPTVASHGASAGCILCGCGGNNQGVGSL